ncbi:MAG: C39 family peptidase [Deltaproteobacteria bacterium]|nr:C39 family peptidase [Deltaproteobacteria bacterium]
MKKSIFTVLCFCFIFTSCATRAVHNQVSAEYEKGGETYILDVPVRLQEKGPCCGSACLGMVMAYWGLSPEAVSALLASPCPREGFSGEELCGVAASVGYSARVYSSRIDDLFGHLSATRPVIVMMGEEGRRHFAVAVGYSKDRSRIILNDPAHGRVWLDSEDFADRWRKAANFALLAVPQGQGK